MIFSCIFPAPPSINAMFIERKQAGKRGRTYTWDYQKWRSDVASVIKQSWRSAGSPEIPKPFAIKLELGINNRSDLDNRVKGALDALCHAIPTPGDQWINRILVERSEEAHGQARLTVERINAD